MKDQCIRLKINPTNPIGMGVCHAKSEPNAKPVVNAAPGKGCKGNLDNDTTHRSDSEILKVPDDIPKYLANEWRRYYQCILDLGCEIDATGFMDGKFFFNQMTTLGNQMTKKEMQDLFWELEKRGGLVESEGFSGKIHLETLLKYYIGII